MPMCLYIVYGYLCVATAELSSSSENILTPQLTKPKIFTIWFLAEFAGPRSRVFGMHVLDSRVTPQDGEGKTQPFPLILFIHSLLLPFEAKL